MTEEVAGRSLGIVPADFAPDVVDPGGQIVLVDRAAGRIAESVGGVVVGPARQSFGFDRPGLADVITAADQPAGQPSGRACKAGPAGELDELPPTDRAVDDLMIMPEDAFVHTQSFALIVAEQGIIAKNYFDGPEK